MYLGSCTHALTVLLHLSLSTMLSGSLGIPLTCSSVRYGIVFAGKFSVPRRN